jgi:tetratricopeptide (TPR) repeat protein
MGELPDGDWAAVERLLAEGEECADEGRDAEALARFQAAWDLLPEPKAECEPALRVLAAIADSYFHLGNWPACYKTLQTAVKNWDVALENPFIRLRMGQSLFEMGDLREAGNWMVPAYVTEGKRLFEDEEPKYLAFVKAQLAPPPGGWPEGW